MLLSWRESGGIVNQYLLELIFYTILFIGFLISLIRFAKEEMAEVNMKSVEIEACVVNRRQTLSKSRSSYYVTFELESKECIEFKVMWIDYENINYYECGKLTYKGGIFISFVARYTELRR